MRLLITESPGSWQPHDGACPGARRQVFGSMRWRSKTENIDHLRHRITLVECDLRDLSSVRNLLEIAAPTDVVHLAAQSFVAASWKAPAETLTTNILSQVNLLEAMRDLKIAPRFLAVGSSEEYGLVHSDELPIKETNPLRPLSPYAVSKVAQDMMGYQYFKSYGLPTHPHARAFNHEGRAQARRRSSLDVELSASQVGRESRGRPSRRRCCSWGDLKPEARYFRPCATSCEGNGHCGSWARGRARCTTGASGRLLVHPAGARRPDRAVPSQGHHGQDPIPTQPATLRRDGAPGRSRQGSSGRVGGKVRDSLRAHLDGAPRILAAADHHGAAVDPRAVTRT